MVARKLFYISSYFSPGYDTLNNFLAAAGMAGWYEYESFCLPKINILYCPLSVALQLSPYPTPIQGKTVEIEPSQRTYRDLLQSKLAED